MRLLIRQGPECTDVTLSEGRWCVGGGAEDALRLEGLPAALVELRLEGQHLTVTFTQALPVNGTSFPAQVPRLFTTGECITLPDGAELVLAEGEDDMRAGTETVAVLRELFKGELHAVATRAATLTCLTGLDAGRVFALSGSDVLGRGDQVSLRIRDRSVSRRHARIYREAERFFLEDLHSPNGTFVGSLRCERKCALSNGDTLELGRAVLRFNDSTPDPQKKTSPLDEAGDRPTSDAGAERSQGLAGHADCREDEAGASADGAASPDDAAFADRPLAGTAPFPSLARRELALLSLATVLATTGACIGWIFR